MTYSSGKDTALSYREIDGAKAYLERVNRNGGVNGQQIRLVTLDSGSSPAQHERNLRSLVREQGAIALLGCYTEPLCQVSARVAKELGVPLIAPMSGHSALSRTINPFVFRLRPDYATEAAALAAQLTSQGISRVAILTDGVAGVEIDEVVRETLAGHGLRPETVRMAPDSDAAAAQAAAQMSHYQAVVLNLSSTGLETLVRLGLTEVAGTWPPVLMTMSIGNQPLLMRSFRGTAIGFTQVVPNPELSSILVARELQRDAEIISPLALTFEGMEAYLGARLLVEALRQSKSTASDLRQVIQRRESWDLGGFFVSFSGSRSTGSTKVEIGMRSRSGVLMK